MPGLGIFFISVWRTILAKLDKNSFLRLHKSICWNLSNVIFFWIKWDKYVLLEPYVREGVHTLDQTGFGWAHSVHTHGSTQHCSHYLVSNFLLTPSPHCHHRVLKSNCVIFTSQRLSGLLASIFYLNF